MITCFQIITADEWGNLLSDAYLANSWIGFVFVTSLFFVGSYIGLNMFGAIVLFGFEEEDGEEEINRLKPKLFDALQFHDKGDFHFEKYTFKFVKEEIARKEEELQKSRGRTTTKIKQLYELSEQPIRRVSYDIVKTTCFENLLFVLIIGSCITLIVENPKNDEATQDILKIVNISWAIIFTFEMLIKLLAFGFSYQPGQTKNVDASSPGSKNQHIYSNGQIDCEHLRECRKYCQPMYKEIHCKTCESCRKWFANDEKEETERKANCRKKKNMSLSRN